METITIIAIVSVVVLQLLHMHERRQKDKDFVDTVKEQARLIKAQDLQDFIVMSPETPSDPEEEKSNDLIDIEDLTPDILNEK